MKNLIKNSLPYFIFRKFLHYRNYSDTYYGNDVVLSKLFSEGIVVIPDFIEKEKCDNIISFYNPLFDEISMGSFSKTKFHYLPEYGVTRILEADILSSVALEFFNNQFIHDIAKKFVSPNAFSYQNMIELRSGDNSKSKADGKHFDDWRQRFKAFLYLNDVSIENAPFRYFPGSHLGKGWFLRRLISEHEYFRFGRSGKFGYFTNDEFSKFEHKLAYPEKVCCGSAGTLILVDTRGLHSGTPLLSGKRLMLASYFDVR